MKNQFYSFLSILLLEGIYFYNYTTPEFNVYVCELPFWSLTVLFCWNGFKNNEDVDFLINLFGEENIILINQEEMYNMNSNIFSISENIVVSEKGFTRLNTELRNRGFIVEEIQYSEIAKMEGLLRCSTMPLKRK